tara:strand:- start:623 stop:1678 length:1056 start_codon:yes stop_codon:yes gene_type:complete
VSRNELPELDLDLWFLSAAELLPEYSLVRDEILAEQMGKSHVYRKGKAGREMSVEAIRRSLPIGGGIGERRKRLSQILIGRNSAASAISEFFKEQGDKQMGHHTRDTDNMVPYPGPHELFAALIVTAGPKKAFQSIKKYREFYYGEYEQLGWIRHDSASRHDTPLPAFCLPMEMPTQSPERFGFLMDLPPSVLICNEEEAKELIEYLFSAMGSSIKKNYKEAKGGLRDEYGGEKSGYRLKNYRIGLAGITDVYFPTIGTFDHKMEDHTVLGLLLRKYPSLMEIVAGYGWSSVVSDVYLESADGEAVYFEDAEADARESEVEGSQFEKQIGDEITELLVSPAHWHLSRSIVP